jgi:hypothetical protein
MSAIVLPSRPGEQGDKVVALHRALDLLGFNVDPIEKQQGLLGPKTQELIEQVGANLGMPHTSGEVSQELAVRLNELVAERDLIDALSENGPLAKALADNGTLAIALSSKGDLARALGPEGLLFKALAANGALAKALADNGALAIALSSKGDLAQALGPKGSLINALSEEGALAKALADNGALATALSSEGALAQAIGPEGLLIKALTEDGELVKALAADGALATALGKNGDLYELLNGLNGDQSFVRGRVLTSTGKPLPGCVVRVFGVTEKGNVTLGEDTTAVDGGYSVRYARPARLETIHLAVAAFDRDGQPLCVPVDKENATAREEIDLHVGIASKPKKQLWLEGRIVMEDGREADDIRLRLYRRNFGGELVLLKETKTVEGGRYSFAYDPADKAMSLEIHAVPNKGDERVLSKPLNDISGEDRTAINLVAPAALKPLDPEYQRLTSALVSLLDDDDLTQLANAEETTERQDITVLNRATGWDARLIALTATTERLAKDVGLNSEALYGLLRAGLPTDKRLLAQLEPDAVEMTLKKMRDKRIVQIDDDHITEFKTKFTEFADMTRLTMPVPGSRSTYGELLHASQLPEDLQSKFASVYLNHHGDSAHLWEEARKKGLNDNEIGKLQLQGKLAFLAGNSAAMTARLLNEKGLKDPGDLAEQGFYDAAEWKKEVIKKALGREDIPEDPWANSLKDAQRKELEKKLDVVIPPSYAGGTVEVRLDAYAEDMARKVRLSYPTHVLGHLLENDKHFKLSSGHTATIKLLKQATSQGFRLGETPVSMFLQSNPDLGSDLDQADRHTAAEHLKTMQRVYQITPCNEAMPVLMSLGMKSAFDVTAYPEAQFISLFNAKYQEIWKKPAPVTLPGLIIRKAKQVSSVTYNLFAIVKKLDSEPSVMAISGTAGQQERAKLALKGALKNLPTMESLFGSMDYCECEHCRSVLSPAAYLVDLLQFVDTEPGVWGNFLAQWKTKHGGEPYQSDWNKKPDGTERKEEERKPYDALIERRPDLPHIPLTCENTHTALPYIDIVNEILEYYVANGKLAKEAAHDTGDATAAELLAEPQQVVREAYDELQKARYPLNLPFDLWIETVRKFCDYFEMPLHRVLDAIRPDEDLWAIIQNPTNVNNAIVCIGNAAASKLAKGMVCTYISARTNAPCGEWKRISEVGVHGSGGEGHTAVTFEGIWTSAPSSGDQLVSRPLDHRAAILMESLGLSPSEVEIFADPKPLLKWHELYGFNKATDALTEPEESATNPRVDLNSAKALSRRLGVTYKEIAEIVQTTFVNPELGKLSLLYKLHVNVCDARLYKDEKLFYDANKELLGKERSDLSTADQQQFDALANKRTYRGMTGWDVLHEVQSLEQRLAELAAAFEPPLNVADLQSDIQNIPIDRVLVLADADAGCNFDQTTLRYADGTKARPIVFLRINLFVRLWRKLGWSIEETDRALSTFVPQSTPYDDTADNLARQPLKTTLIYLAHLKALDAKLTVGKQSRLKLPTLWSDIATTGKKPLYTQLFLNRSVLENSPVFDHPLGKYLTDPGIKLKDHVVTLQGALGLTADEIDRILADAGKPLDTAELSLGNVSLLYRFGLLAKALKLSVRELIALKMLSGLDPFKALHPNPLETLDQDYPLTQTLEFVKVAEEVKDSGLKIEDLEFLLQHRFDETGKYRPNREGELALLKSLSEGVRAIRVEHAVPDNPGTLSEEELRQELGLVLPPDVVERFLSMVNGMVEFTASKLGVEQHGELPPVLAGEAGILSTSYEEATKTQKLSYRGVLFEIDKIALQRKLNPRLTRSQRLVLENLLTGVQAQAVANVTDQFTATVENVHQGCELPANVGGLEGDFSVSFDATTRVQRINYHGVLTDQEKSALTQRIAGQLTTGQADVFQRLLAGVQSSIRTSVTSEFTAEEASVFTGGELPPDVVAAEARIREAPYDPIRQEQKLTVRGVLFDPAKSAVKATFASALTEAQKTTFADLLDSVQKLARYFFDNQFQKKKLRIEGETGFLEEYDFTGTEEAASLFTPLESLKAILATDSPEEEVSKQKQNQDTEERNQKELQNRRYRIGQAILPVLQNRLIRQYVVQTLMAHTGADPVLVESLVSDERLLAAPKTLLDLLAATAARGLDGTFWPSVDASGAPTPVVLLADADTSAKDSGGEALRPTGADSARFDAYLEVPITGAYRFYVELDKQKAQAKLQFPHRPDPVLVKGEADSDGDTLGDQLDEYLELKAGMLYRFSLELTHLNGGNARLLVQGETVPRGSLSQLVLYPAAVLEAAEHALTLLTKTLQLVQSLGLSQRELQYLLTHAPDFDGLTLSDLPTVPSPDLLSPAERTATSQRFARFRRLSEYARLKRDLVGGTDDLISVFEANGTTATDRLEKHVYPLLAKLTRRNEATIKATAEALAKPAAPTFESEKPLWRLWQALQVVERFGVPPTSLLKWADLVNNATTRVRRSELARDVKEATKARFEPETWQRVAQPIFDKLRPRQRDALVSYVLQQMSKKPETMGIDTLEKLYEYFLVDPGMEPIVQTSRIRLAISSLQLFIQRCLLNMETRVHPSTINSEQWEWMKRYRVWEANRKIFLFPENWLEPEFRDDKTHLFAELEGSLLQGDVSSDLVEDAFLNYLKKLDELARLDICAMHIEDNIDPAQRVLHVFGRTYSQPHKYFYRRYAHQMWAPWEPVSAEIEGDHLAPVVWRDRLYLFWVTFLEKAQQVSDKTIPDPTNGITIPSVKFDVEAQLHWSEYMTGEWTTSESGDFKAPSPVVAQGLKKFDPRSVFVHVTKEKEDTGEEGGVYVHLHQTLGSAMVTTSVSKSPLLLSMRDLEYQVPEFSFEHESAPVSVGEILGGDASARPFNGAFYLASRNSPLESGKYVARPANPFHSANTPVANRYRGGGALKVSFKERITTEPGKTQPASNPDVLKNGLEKGADYLLLPCNNDVTLGVSEDVYQNAANPDAVKEAIERGMGEIATLMKPVFYQDRRHTFFVEPDVSEQTIEEWQGWIMRFPTIESPDRWKDIEIKPVIPRGKMSVADDLWRLQIHSGSLINPVPDRDWIINPVSVIKFGNVLIGPSGQPGIEIRPSTDPADDLVRMNVGPGGDLSSGNSIVVTDPESFARSGLQEIAGGLNIVGDAGFNSALEKNFNDLNQSGLGAGRFER